jgi:hypothetical protein
VVVVAVAVIALLARGGSTPAAGGTGTAASPDSGSSTSAAAPSASGAATPRATPSATSRASAAVPVPSVILEQPTPSAKPAASGSARPKPTPLPGLSPAAAPRTTVPAPSRAASTRGRLAPDYPSAVLEVPAGSSIISSSVTPEGRQAQSTLVATTARSRGGLLAFYRRSLARNDLSGTSAPAVSGARAYSFTGPVGSVTLTLEKPRDGRVTYSLVATLRTGR